MHQYWFLPIVPLAKLGMLSFAVILAACLTLMFALLFGVIWLDGIALNRIADLGTSMFFATLVAYSMVAGSCVLRRSSRAMQELRPAFDYDDSEFPNMLESMEKTNLGKAATFAVIGLAGSIAHSVVL
jgi:hypothetical protein